MGNVKERETLKYSWDSQLHGQRPLSGHRSYLEKEKKGKSKHDGFDVSFVESEIVGHL